MEDRVTIYRAIPCLLFIKIITVTMNRFYSYLALSGFFMLNIIVFALPAEANISVLNGLTHEYVTSVGSTIEGTIDIKNYSETSQYVKIYQTDYRFNFQGEVFYDEPGKLDRSNAGWIELSADYISVNAGEILSYKYKITVPDDSLMGSYWSVIMVEGVQEPDTTLENKLVSIQSVVRYGIQVITQIEDTGTMNLEFLDIQLLQEEVQYILQVDLENTGERFLRPFLKLELFDETGESRGVFESEKRKTYPGTSVRLTIPLSDLEMGKYQSLLVAETGEDEVFGVNLELEIK